MIALLDQLNEFLPTLLRKAGKIILSAHVKTDDDSITTQPGSANFVTVYDVSVQNFLMREIKARFPSATFIAEEKDNDSGVLESDCCFIIDPIDGTTNFIHDYRHSCISVAVISHNEPIFGAVYDPYLDEYFHAQKGGGAYLGKTPLRVTDMPFENALIAFGTSPYYKDTLVEPSLALAKELLLAGSDIRRCGSAALDLSYLAAGRNDAFFEMILSPWDFAAGYLLITEAGGIITRLDGSPLDFSKPQSVIASNRVIYPALLEITKKYA